jgi:transposase-like protein
MGEYKDLRIKISLEQKSDIIQKHKIGYNVRELAAEYGVSKPTIYYVLSPERYARHIKNKRGTWKKYYTTERATKWKQDFRKRRKET